MFLRELIPDFDLILLNCRIATDRFLLGFNSLWPNNLNRSLLLSHWGCCLNSLGVRYSQTRIGLVLSQFHLQAFDLGLLINFEGSAVGAPRRYLLGA